MMNMVGPITGFLILRVAAMQKQLILTQIQNRTYIVRSDLVLYLRMLFMTKIQKLLTIAMNQKLRIQEYLIRSTLLKTLFMLMVTLV